MTQPEFAEAVAYLHEEPLDPAMLDAIATHLAATANGPLVKRDKTPFTAADFAAPRWPADETPAAAPTRATSPTRAQLAALRRKP